MEDRAGSAYSTGGGLYRLRRGPDPGPPADATVVRVRHGDGCFAFVDAIGRKHEETWVSMQMGAQMPAGGQGVKVAELAVGGSTVRRAVVEPERPRVALPPPNVTRWTIRRKAAVVTAVANGLLTREEACRRYQLTEEEFASWQRAFETYGLPGLRSTRIQQYRDRTSRE